MKWKLVSLTEGSKWEKKKISIVIKKVCRYSRIVLLLVIKWMDMIKYYTAHCKKIQDFCNQWFERWTDHVSLSDCITWWKKSLCYTSLSLIRKHNYCTSPSLFKRNFVGNKRFAYTWSTVNLRVEIKLFLLGWIILYDPDHILPSNYSNNCSLQMIDSYHFFQTNPKNFSLVCLANIKPRRMYGNLSNLTVT